MASGYSINIDYQNIYLLNTFIGKHPLQGISEQ